MPLVLTSVSHSFISTSGEEEPSQILLRSQPADHNAPFSLNSLPCTLEQEEKGVTTTVASRITATTAAADTSIPTCSWNITQHKAGAQGLWGPCLSPISTWWNRGHGSITACCPQVLQHTEGLGEGTAWTLPATLLPLFTLFFPLPDVAIHTKNTYRWSPTFPFLQALPFTP